MYYKRHYSLWGYPNIPELKEMLEKKYRIACTLLNSGFLIFDIADNAAIFPEIERRLPPLTTDEEMERLLAQDDRSPRARVQYNPVFSEKELLAAEWLEFRAISLKVDPQNDETLWKTFCVPPGAVAKPGMCVMGRHLVIDEPFALEHPVKLRPSQFFCTSVVFQQTIFCSALAKEFLEAENLHGITYLPVMKRGGKAVCDDLFQLDAATIPAEALVPLQYMKQRCCEFCGMPLLTPLDGRERFGIDQRFLDSSVDIYKTPPMFSGTNVKIPYACKERFLISAKFYRVLKQKRMTRGLKFKPLPSALPQD